MLALIQILVRLDFKQKKYLRKHEFLNMELTLTE